MNTSILIKSFGYIETNFKTLVSIASWIHECMIDIKYETTKLIRSLERADLEVIKVLIVKNTEPSILNPHLLMYPEHREIFKVLILNGANKYLGMNILKRICDANDYDIFEFLLEQKVTFFNDYYTLNFFAEHGRLDFIKLFEQKVSDLNPDMVTAACKKSQFKVVGYLTDEEI